MVKSNNAVWSFYAATSDCSWPFAATHVARFPAICGPLRQAVIGHCLPAAYANCLV